MKPEFPSEHAFWILADAFCDSGKATLGMIRRSDYVGMAFMPCVFLFFRAVELSLKSVLVHYGFGEKEIRKLSHSLSALLAEVEKLSPLNDFGITAADRGFLDRHSANYSNKWFEYSDDWWRNVGRLEDLDSLASRVCESVRTLKHDRRK